MADIKIAASRLEPLSDEDWGKLLSSSAFEFERVWVGDDGVFVEREIVGTTDCLATGLRASDGEDVLQEICAFAELYGDELVRRRRHFNELLLDASDPDER